MVATQVIVTDEFREWYTALTMEEQSSVQRVVGMLEELGPVLDHPYSSAILRSKHSHMRELRIQHQGMPLRALYAFDPARNAVLLVGGNKTGKGRWYETAIRLADRLLDEYLKGI